MTEYDYWPPIRFRFAGDVEQAKGRIPQARTLMSQLIRRMEGQERDAGQWQGQLSDGTQFRVAKMGDVHVADIFGVSPVQMPPTVSAVDYGTRDDGMPLTEGVARPEMPEAPHVNPREILMRPHGERFNTDEGYLWIGVRVILPEFNHETHPHKFVFSSTTTETTEFWPEFFRTPYTRPEAINWPVYLYEDPYFGTSGTRYNTVTDVVENTNEDYIPVKPKANIVLFEPSASQAIGKVFQTNDAYERGQYTYKATVESSFSNIKYIYKGRSWWPAHNAISLTHNNLGNERAFVLNCSRTIYDEARFMPIGLEKYVYNTEYANLFHKSENGAYTTAPFISKKENSIQVHSYLTIDPADRTKRKTDLYAPAKVSTNDYEVAETIYADNAIVANEETNSVNTVLIPEWEANPKGGMYKDFKPGYTLPDLFVTPTPDYYAELVDSGFGLPNGAWTTDDREEGSDWVEVDSPAGGLAVSELTKTSSSYVASETEAKIEFDNSFISKAKIIDGVYEIRLSAGWDSGKYQNYAFWEENPVDCEVYIQLGKKINKYTVALTLSSYADKEGYFNEAEWREQGAPTVFDHHWHQGCWLIDIKKGTVIHETDPANLDRPWFTQ
jgi:hypothetical protein